MYFELAAFPNQETSIKDLRVSEPMHSSIGPWAEANLIYIEQAHLEKQLSRSDLATWVVFDIGLGLGANALATIEAFEACQGPRNLHLISFEQDISGLRFALQNVASFPFLEKYRNRVETLLMAGSFFEVLPWGASLQWDLRTGDFRTLISAGPMPDLIYFDLYSPKTCPELWGFLSFKLLHEISKQPSLQGAGTKVLTYSSSTSVRSAMLLAGFFVGEGKGTPVKLNSTVASTEIKQLDEPLTQNWLDHWMRSSKPMPVDCPLSLRDQRKGFAAISHQVLLHKTVD